jgi:hypothetical protein
MNGLHRDSVAGRLRSCAHRFLSRRHPFHSVEIRRKAHDKISPLKAGLRRVDYAQELHSKTQLANIAIALRQLN